MIIFLVINSIFLPKAFGRNIELRVKLSYDVYTIFIVHMHSCVMGVTPMTTDIIMSQCVLLEHVVLFG